MSESFDCIVLGVGGFGSGALYHLARRGARVLGLEQFGIAHNRGSSHGETRIIRKAYFEHPDYVPLLQQAYDLWAELEQESGASLYRQLGLLTAGPADGVAVPGALLAARQHGLRIEELSHAQAAARFPAFRIPEHWGVVFEQEAGGLAVERCVATHIQQALAAGAVLKTGETVRAWQSDGRSVTVRTETATYTAGSLVITAGPWTGPLLAELGVPLQVVRKVVFWHPVQSRAWDANAGCPLFFFEVPEGEFYGFPCLDGRTVKVAEHTGGEPVADPSSVDRELHPSDQAAMRQFIGRFLPDLAPQPERYNVCMYTKTRDSHFIIDRHPDYGNVVLGAGFSGHGFKFTSVLGQALAELAGNGKTEKPIGFLSVSRPGLR
jgi:sarcosine oxidase